MTSSYAAYRAKTETIEGNMIMISYTQEQAHRDMSVFYRLAHTIPLFIDDFVVRYPGPVDQVWERKASCRSTVCVELSPGALRNNRLCRASNAVRNSILVYILVLFSYDFYHRN